jgi:hypothetical protein
VEAYACIIVIRFNQKQCRTPTTQRFDRFSVYTKSVLTTIHEHACIAKTILVWKYFDLYQLNDLRFKVVETVLDCSNRPVVDSVVQSSQQHSSRLAYCKEQCSRIDVSRAKGSKKRWSSRGSNPRPSADIAFFSMQSRRATTALQPRIL